MGMCKVGGYDWSTLYFLSLGIGVLACCTHQHIKDVPVAPQLGWSRAGVDGVEPQGSLLFFCAPSLHGQMGSNYYGWGMEAQGSFSDCRVPLKLHYDGGSLDS